MRPSVRHVVIRAPQLAPYLLSGTVMPPHLLKQFVFTDLVPAHEVMPKALEWASKIVECSPDAVWVTKEQINLFKGGQSAGRVNV